jgi:DegV family protein with EDD domain
VPAIALILRRFKLIRTDGLGADARTAVVTDTTAYLPEELVAERGIHRVSLYVTLDGEQQRESEISGAGYDDFYERLRRSESGATTSQPSVGDFTSIYEPLLADGRDVVSLHISAGISGTYQAALQARQELADAGKGGERITVWDSRSGCGGQGLMVLTAANAAARGASGDETMQAVERARTSLRMWFAIDTLEYLRRGGRIGSAQAWLGSALQIKPILTLEEEITPIERVRTSRRAFERLVEFAREQRRAGSDGWVVQHIHDADAARRLVDECRQLFGSDPVFVSEIGPVIGAHIGPGLLGFGGMPRELLGDAA